MIFLRHNRPSWSLTATNKTLLENYLFSIKIKLAQQDEEESNVALCSQLASPLNAFKKTIDAVYDNQIFFKPNLYVHIAPAIFNVNSKFGRSKSMWGPAIDLQSLKRLMRKLCAKTSVVFSTLLRDKCTKISIASILFE